MSLSPYRRCPRLLLAAACLAPVALSACGDEEDSESVEATPLEITISEDGRGSAVFDVPADVAGGLTELTVTNEGEGSHLAQLIRTDEGRTADEVLGVITGDAPPPEWLYGEGGIGELEPGQSGTATLNLDPGSYVIADLLAPEGSEAPPGYEELTVGEGKEGELPSTTATVTAAALDEAESAGEAEGDAAEEKYDWEVTALGAGENDVTFVSEGEDTLHHIVAIPIIGDATFEEVQEEFRAQQGEPTTVDFDRAIETAVFDGGKSGVIDLELDAGRYVFACFLPDKGEDTPHVEQGLFDEIEIPEG